ncbi:MAG: Hsp20/alpha crystallin family protein [Kiritimatiellae bacterium]|nr:Hsp20/alpha crystallin family protein [Kiritimatiellia bacterium]
MSKTLEQRSLKGDAPAAEVDRRVRVTPRGRVVALDEAYEMRLEMPGADEQSLRIGVEYRTLTVDAETAVSKYEGYRLVREEFPPAIYHGVYEVPERVDTAGIKARLVNGVLTLTLPKREEVKPRRIAVETN